MENSADHAAAPKGSGRVLPRRGYLLALVVLLGSLCIVVAMWRTAYEREISAAHVRFVSRTEQITELLREQMINHELVARGGGALFATVARPSPRQWQAYVDGMNIGRRFPSMVALGFSGYVPHSQLPALQLEWREAGHGLLEITPRGPRSAYGPILYLEPNTPENAAARGFDMYSEPVRHAAMQAALESGEPRLSGPVQLVQDGSQRTAGLLLYFPVYSGGNIPATAAARREAMQGWVYIPFRVHRFVEDALDAAHQGQRFRILDVTGGVESLLFTTRSESDGEPPAFQHSTELDQYGRTWRFEFESAPLEVAAPRLSSLQNTLALGIFASLLMYAIAGILARTEARAQKIAARMTEDYRRSELRFRGAMHYSAIGKALLDSEGRIVEANPALGRIVGREPVELVGHRFDSLFEGEDAAATGSVDAVDSSGDGQRIHRSTRRMHREGGLPRHAQLTYSQVPGNVGQDITGLVQVEDVTERIRAEAKVHALNRTLEARVAMRTRELSLANQELESFAYSVSHDLRAPLRSIDGFSRILMERYSSRLDEAGTGYLVRVRKAAGRMGELIDALLKMSRVTRGELKTERVNFSRMAAEVLEELRADDSGHQPQVQVEPDLFVDGDAALLRNLLYNLLGNAWKFTSERDDARIDLGATQTAAGETEFFVSDNGAGFPQDYVGKLFRPFQRLHAQDHFAGHGIGLASVRRIVERHGGSIRAEGREGEGATFWFTLPGDPGQE